MEDFLKQLFSPGTFSSTIRLATPIAYAALGAMFCELSGIVNIALEGQLLAGSFCAIVVTYFTGDPLLGAMGGIAGATLVAGLFGVFSIHMRGNQIIIGTGINIAAAGLFGYLSFVMFRSPGVTPAATGIRAVAIPFLSEIPWVGQIFFTHTPTVLLLPFVVAAASFLLYRTPLGLRIRVCGDNPLVAEASGINVYKVRLVAVLLSGLLTGLGGVNISLEGAKFYQDTMVAGRGFIGLAANISGGWTPIGGPLVSLLFGFAQALMFRVQGFRIPQEFFFMLPYALTMIVLVGAARRALSPQALGKEFKRKG